MPPAPAVPRSEEMTAPNEHPGSFRSNARKLSLEVEKAAAPRGNRASLSLARLRVVNMRLHGREDDLKLLKSKLLDLIKGKGTDPVAKPELLLVAGASGTGKSALVVQGLRDPAQKLGIAFASGKFDQKRTALPLSAFVDAMHLLTKHIVGQKHVQKIRGGIRESLGEDDILLLSRAMPGCRDLFFRDKTESTHGRPSLGGGKEAIMRLQHMIRRLLKVICTNLKGVVLFMDDLQWADSQTLDLIRSISLDSGIPSLLLVGAYRDDEVPDSHPLTVHLREWARMGTASTVKIGNLSCDSVRSLLAEALNTEDNDDALDSLATTVHKKTGGNAFFVLLFLGSLQDEGLLQYNVGVMKWVWDDDAVNAKLYTENIASALVNKLKRSKESSQTMLKISSCLGASFSISVLAKVVGAFSSRNTKIISNDEEPIASVVSSSVHEFEEEGLWERETEDIWQFSHDQIQSAAFELIPSEERNSFRGEVGDILIKELPPESLEESLFEAVSLRNCVMSSISGDERRSLARMNLSAGLKATGSAAFGSAATYFKAGRALLGENAWEVDRDTTLRLCSEGANSCFVIGDIKAMNAFIDEVLSRDIEVKDKFKAFEVKIQALQSAQKFGESIDTALEVRRQLRLRTPQNQPASTFTVQKEFAKTNRVLSGRSAKEIASLPGLKDERIIMGQRMLELLLTSTYQGQPSLYPVISFLLVRASVKHGLNASSCKAFCSFGLLLCGAFGQLKRGYEMGKAVDLMLANPGMRRMQSRSLMLCNTTITHWTSPLQGTFAPLLEGYQLGLETGDVESAGFNLSWRGILLWYAGRPLDGLQHELQTSVSVLAELNHVPARMLVLPFLIAVKKLRGVQLQRQEIDLESISKLASKKGNRIAHAIVVAVQLELYVIFQDWGAAMTLLLGSGDLHSPLVGMFNNARVTFLEGLVYLKKSQASASWLEKQKWKRKGKKITEMLLSWLRQGNVNVLHTAHLLTAQLALLEGNKKGATENFKLAIAAASRSGFLQDKALTHELAGAYQAARGDDYWANYHMECAQKTYSDWGATVKVKELNKQR